MRAPMRASALVHPSALALVLLWASCLCLHAQDCATPDSATPDSAAPEHTAQYYADQYALTVRVDLSDLVNSEPLPDMLKPNAHYHPLWNGGDMNSYPINYWQYGNDSVPRWDEGTYMFFIDLWLVDQGSITIAPGGRLYNRLTDLVQHGVKNIFIGIDRIPYALEPPQGQQNGQQQGRFPPTDYDEYQKMMEVLVSYFSVEGVTMPDDPADPYYDVTEQLGLCGQESLGIDHIHYLFWHETNNLGYLDPPDWGDWYPWKGPDMSEWLKLYDYWIAGIRRVRARYPGTVKEFKVGINFQGDNYANGETTQGQLKHEEFLDDLEFDFLPFINGTPPDYMKTYVYHNDPPPQLFNPLDLDFYAFNIRRNINEIWNNPWDDSDRDGDGFLEELELIFHNAGFDESPGGFQYTGWSLQSDHRKVESFILPGTPEVYDTKVQGVERDSDIGAAAQIAQQFDAWRSPWTPLSLTFAEWISDPSFANVNPGVPEELFPYYRGDVGSAFTFSPSSNNLGGSYINTAYNMIHMTPDNAGRKGNYIKATYNVMRMMGMQEDHYLYPTYYNDGSPSGKNYVGGIVTRNDLGGPGTEHVVVLLWYYIPPEDFNRKDYDELHQLASQLPINMSVVLDGFNEPGTPGVYHLTRYVVDETHSNGFKYRQQIYNLRDDPRVSRNAINRATFARGARISVGLDEVPPAISDYEPDSNGTITITEQSVVPWTVILLDLRWESR